MWSDIDFEGKTLTVARSRVELGCGPTTVLPSGRDRHANFGTGQIDPELLVAVVKAADAPVICETADEGRKDDIAFLREKTGD